MKALKIRLVIQITNLHVMAPSGDSMNFTSNSKTNVDLKQI